MNKIKHTLMKTFFVVFSFLFAYILISTLFFNNNFSYSPFITLPISLVFIAVFSYIYNVGEKLSFKFTPFVIIGAMVCIYIGFTPLLHQTLSGDLGDIFKGAVIWTVQGDSEAFASFKTYYEIYPNNLGLFAILQFLFRVVYRFGFDDFYFVAVALNIVLITLAIIFMYLYLKNVFDKKIANIGLIIMACYLPLYFFSSVFYTDTFAMFFISASLYVNTIYDKNMKYKYLLLTILSLLISIGFKIKATVFIVAIAIIISSCFTMNVKEVLKKILAIVCTLVVVNLIFNIYIYNVENFVSKENVEKNSIPVTHWLMMGLSDNGDYFQEDYEYTSSFNTKEEKQSANIEKIKERLSEINIVSHITQKTTRTFGSGNADTSTYLNLLPKNKNILHEVCLEDGAYYFIYDNICQGFWVAILILITIGSTKLVFSKKTFNFSPWLSILGLYIFYLMWEASQRYTLSFMPVFVMLAIESIHLIMEDIYDK